MRLTKNQKYAMAVAVIAVLMWWCLRGRREDYDVRTCGACWDTCMKDGVSACEECSALKCKHAPVREGYDVYAQAGAFSPLRFN